MKVKQQGGSSAYVVYYKIDPEEWPLVVTEEGFSMRHRDTGESYQAMNARLEHEHQQALKNIK